MARGDQKKTFELNFWTFRIAIRSCYAGTNKSFWLSRRHEQAAMDDLTLKLWQSSSMGEALDLQIIIFPKCLTLLPSPGYPQLLPLAISTEPFAIGSESRIRMSLSTVSIGYSQHRIAIEISLALSSHTPKKKALDIIEFLNKPQKWVSIVYTRRGEREDCYRWARAAANVHITKTNFSSLSEAILAYK